MLAAALCQWSCSAVRDDLFAIDESDPVWSEVPARKPDSGSPVVVDASAVPSGGAAAPAADGGMGLAGAGGSARPGPSTAPPFRWTETIPGAGACQAATFMGQFSCTVDGLVGDNQFSGTLVLFFKGASETQLFSVDRSQITVYDESMKAIVSTEMTGLLDCSTERLIAALVPKMSEMMPLERIANWLSVNPTPIVSGTLKGPLDPDFQTISGEITLVFEPMPRCTGTFRLQGSPGQ